MIKRPTVFVIGAGASTPFKFPTSQILREMLCDGMRDGTRLFKLISANGFSKENIDSLRSEFEQSALSSIDTFIGYRPCYQDIAETAIAAALLPIENVFNLTNVNQKSGNADWYQFLWNELLSGATDPDDLLENSVKFVTFNYDRSLEQFLLNAIQSTFGISQKNAHNILKSFDFKHVYGSLGDYTEESGYSYGGHSEDELQRLVFKAKATIKTVPLSRGDIDPEVSGWLEHAHRVYVLGFGFDATNAHRIGLRNACALSPERITPRHIYATSYNLTHLDEQWCVQNVFLPGHGGPRWFRGDSLNLLRECRGEMK